MCSDCVKFWYNSTDGCQSKKLINAKTPVIDLLWGPAHIIPGNRAHAIQTIVDNIDTRVLLSVCHEQILNTHQANKRQSIGIPQHNGNTRVQTKQALHHSLDVCEPRERVSNPSYCTKLRTVIESHLKH
jgi:hypothetical protein